MLLRLVPKKTDFRFLRFRLFSLNGSGVLMVASLVLFFLAGLNYGIDFRGGILIQTSVEEAVPIDAYRDVVGALGLGDNSIQEFGTPEDVLIVIEAQSATGGEREVELAQQAALTEARNALAEAFPGIEFERTEVVGPKVSGELVRASTIAVIGAVILVLLYIWFRFEWQFAVGAVAALVHDVVLTIGVFSLLRLEFNLSIIAALLTIVGYSLNDTVVVFDRIRENLRKYKRMPIQELLDQSINDTLSRTVMTSLTTLLALGALYTFGGEVIRGFTFAMIWGVVIGTYSSIFVASPILMMLGVKRDWTEGGEAAATP